MRTDDAYTADLEIPEIEEPIEFGYDRSSILKFTTTVLTFAFIVFLGWLLADSSAGPAHGDIRYASFIFGFSAMLVFGGVVAFQMANIHHFRDRFLITDRSVRVTNPHTGEMEIRWDEVEKICFSPLQDEIHILAKGKKIMIDESIPDYDFYLDLFGLARLSDGGPIRRVKR